MLIDKPRIPLRSILLYGFWPGFMKIILYRLKGYRIGERVSIGFGAVICGERVDIGDHASIGFLTIIRGKEICIGPHVQIGAMTFLDTPYIDIGEDTKINEQVFVGGLQFPDSRFIVGRNCQIQQLAFINPSPSIVIGDDSGIGGHCLIFGHSSFHNQFEGYAAESAPITIGNRVGLAWRVFVLPGTTIGDGTMVGANSVVSGAIPPNSMAVGYPARVVGRPPIFPKTLSDDDKVALFRRMIAEMIRFFMGSGLQCVNRGTHYEIQSPGAGWWHRRRLWRLNATDGDVKIAALHLGTVRCDVFLSFREITPEVREALTSRNIMWIDIAKKERCRMSNDLSEEVVSFLKRYGVRTTRYPRTPAGFTMSTASADYRDV